MCLVRVGLADFHRSAHVHPHPHWSRLQHTGPSAFSVPHLPSAGRHHRGETHKQARVCSQTLQTAARPRGHVARPLLDLPGQEPPFHCAYDADAIPPSLDMQTRTRRKATCVAKQHETLAWDRWLFLLQKSPHEEIGAVLFDLHPHPPPKEKTALIFIFRTR